MGAGASARIRDGLIDGDKLEKMAHSCAEMFEDDEFDPTLDAELLGPRFLFENNDITEEDIYWLRPKEFGPGTLYRDGAQSLDCTACIGALDGCNKDLSTVLQALCARRPDYIMDMIVSYNGIIGCAAIRLFHNGCMEMVVIDDRLPCRLKTPPAPGQPPHQYPFEPISTRLTTGECWLPLIEKAMAKLHGSYTATALGDGCRDLFRDLCGGEHVLDINLKHMEQGQLSALFSALYPRFTRNELIIVARKSHTCSRTWAKKQRSNCVFNLVMKDDQNASGHDPNVNAFGADISNTIRKKQDREDGFAHTLSHCVDQHGDAVFEHVYASAKNTDSQSIPEKLYADIMQQPQMLTQHFDETKGFNSWDDRRFFVCMSEDEPIPVPTDLVGLDIAHNLKNRIEEAKKYEVDRDKNDDELDEDERLAAEKEAAIQKEGGHDVPPTYLPYKSYSPEWMSWTRFCEDFEQIIVCVVASEGHCCHSSHGVDIHPNMGLTMQSAWDPSRGTAGGGQHLKSWRNSPLFRVKLKEFKPCRGRLLITTSLPDARKESYFADTIPDLNQWDGTQYHGGALLYPAHALFVCQDEPSLTNIVINTDYVQQRDVTVEMDLDLRTNGPFSFVVVPCTYADEIRSDFYINTIFYDEDGLRREVEIEPLEEWSGYNYTADVSGQWLKGKSAMGPCSNHNKFSFLNPAWKIRIHGPQCDENSNYGEIGEDSVFDSLPPGTPGVGGISTIEEGKEDMSGLVDTSLAPRDNGGGVNAAGSSVLDVPNLSYEDVNRLNQSSHISVPSNDTGPYSKTRIRKKDDKPSVRYFQICTLLSPSTELATNSRGNSPANSRPTSADPDGIRKMDPTHSRLPRSGTYLLTPNAYSKLLHNNGTCGDQAVHDGFLGRFRFNAYPVTARHEKFCIFNGGVNGSNYLHHGSDVYEELIVMPALNDKGTEGSFNLQVMCNLPFDLEPVELGMVPAPLKDIANMRASVMNASRASKAAAKAARMSATQLSRINSETRIEHGSTRAVAINNNTSSVNLDRLGQLQAGSREGLSDAPTSGVGIQNMPSFQREVITNIIDATSRDHPLSSSDSAVFNIEGPPATLEQPSLASSVVDIGQSPLELAKLPESKAINSTNSMIRSQMGTLKKNLAQQIREDTDRRLNAISIAMWSNENRLESAIKRQYEEEAERDKLGLPRIEGTHGGTVYFQPFHDRSGGMIDKGPAHP